MSELNMVMEWLLNYFDNKQTTEAMELVYKTIKE